MVETPGISAARQAPTAMPPSTVVMTNPRRHRKSDRTERSSTPAPLHPATLHPATAAPVARTAGADPHDKGKTPGCLPVQLWISRSSDRLPDRVAFLDERLARFGHVAGEAPEHLGAVLELDGVAQARRVEVRPEAELGHEDAVLAVGRDLPGEVGGRGEELVAGHDPVEHPEPGGLLGGEAAARQHELRRDRRSHDARKRVARADVARGEADADE